MQTVIALQQDAFEASPIDHEKLSSLFELADAGDTWQVVQGAFAQMEIAEEEISDFMTRYPRQKDAINACFFPLRWVLDTEAPEPVFRHHVRELLQRVVDETSLSPGTVAEVLMMLHRTSLAAPLGAQSAALYVELFESVFGDTLGESDVVIQEPWSGASQELLYDARRRLTLDRSRSE